MLWRQLNLEILICAFLNWEWELAKGCSKGRAIRDICEKLDVNIDDTIGFGDSNNDLAMFQVVHTKVAIPSKMVAFSNCSKHSRKSFP